MTLNEYIDHLSEIKKEYGGELQVIYSSDDEGNNFNTVHFSPSAGQAIEESASEIGFIPAEEIPSEINAVCVN